MSSISLFTNSTTATNEEKVANQAVQKVNDPAADASQDTVDLSEQAQAKLLYQQGQSVAEIAAQMGTSTTAVNGYLGLLLQQELQQALKSINVVG